MKHLKTLGLAAMMAVALLAVVASSASATELTSPAGTRLKIGTTIHAVAEEAVTLTTAFLDIACTESTIQGKTTNETGISISSNVSSLTWGGCNCEVKTLSGGTLLISGGFGNSDGLVTSTNAEITTQCNTIFGAVHCIYKTSATDLGILTGSTTTKATATIDISFAEIPRLKTSAFCAEEADLDAKYKVDNPDTLIVD